MRSNILKFIISSFFGCIIAFSLLASNTRLAVSQLFGLSTTNGSVVVVMPTGQAVQASLSGLTLDTSKTPPVLTATSPHISVTRTDTTSNGSTNIFTLPAACSGGNLTVYRNGILQYNPGDYTVDTTGLQVTFTANSVAQSGSGEIDNLSFICE